jgi:hypothetical protein
MIVLVRRQANHYLRLKASRAGRASRGVIFTASLAQWMNVLDESVKPEGWKDDL